MPPQKTTRPAASSRMLPRQIDPTDPTQAHRAVSDAVSAIETKLGKLQKLITDPVAVTGSKGGNAALASLIAALAQLGLVEDKTT